MPFIPQTERMDIEFRIENGESPIAKTVGQQCYLFYREMVRLFQSSPRWTTIHEIYRKHLQFLTLLEVGDDNFISKQLAWQVFFQLHVMPYELKKREENGDV